MALELEVFKKMSKEEIKEYGKDLSDGYTYDENGNILTYKNSNGFWSEYTRDENGCELAYKNSDGLWYEYTRDENGNVLTFKDSGGIWYEYTYDENGKELTYKDSYGYWREFTRDEKGNALTYKDSNGHWWEYTRDETGKELTFKKSSGVDIVYFFWGIKYALGYDKNTKKYLAGCQTLTYEECEKYYEENKYEYKDSHNFIEAIRNHQKTLTVS